MSVWLVSHNVSIGDSLFSRYYGTLFLRVAMASQELDRQCMLYKKDYQAKR